MKILKRSFLLVALFLSSFLYAQEAEIGITEHLNEKIADDIFFVNENYDTVYLAQLINKPTVISLVYYRCAGICSPLLGGVAEVIDRSSKELGKDYQFITISFNPEENPTMAKEKKKNYLKQINKKIDTDAWIWLTGNQENINKITKTLGFNYQKKGNEWMHTAGIMVISPKATVSRYLYGTYFIPKDLELAIDESLTGKASPSVRKRQKYCYTEVPTGRTYISAINKITAVVMLLGAVIFFVVLMKKKKSNIKS